MLYILTYIFCIMFFLVEFTIGVFLGILPTAVTRQVIRGTTWTVDGLFSCSVGWRLFMRGRGGGGFTHAPSEAALVD